MVRPLSVALAALAAAGCVPTAAATTSPGRTVLVELFTSQGCSSCPAADAFVRELPALGLPRARVVPLTFHVDYWDGLGWKDPFAAPVFTERQRRYAKAGVLRDPAGEGGSAGLTGLYTPQMIVDGSVHFSGRRRDVALEEIRRAAEAPALIDLAADAAVDADQAQVTLRVTPRAGTALGADWRAFVAVAAKAGRTAVARGENRGEVLEEAAIVRAMSAPVPLPPAPGAPLRISVSRPPDLPWSAIELAVVVQSARTMRVGAARSIIPPSPSGGDAR